MILPHPFSFFLFPSLFLVNPNKHIRAEYFSSPLDKMSLDNKEIRLLLGCPLDFELYFRYSPEDKWQLLLTSNNLDEIYFYKLSILKQVKSLIKQLQHQDLCKSEELRELLKQLDITEITEHFELEMKLKLFHNKKEILFGEEFLVAPEPFLSQLPTSKNEVAKNLYVEIGKSCLPKEGISFKCNYCGRPLIKFGYYVRRLENLFKADFINVNDDEVEKIWIRLARFACIEPEPDPKDPKDYKCCECKRRNQSLITHAVAPCTLIIPFLRYEATLINDAITIFTKPESLEKVLKKVIYKHCPQSFLAIAATHKRQWLHHYNVVQDKLKSCNLQLALAEHERDKISRQVSQRTRDSAQKRLQAKKFLNLSFIRSYVVLLSDFVIKRSTYYFFPPDQRPFKISTS